MKFQMKRRVATVAGKARQIRGKFRRFFLDKFKLGFIRRQLSSRQGQCLMCGRCCSLVYRCPFLVREGDLQVCSIYRIRPAQCRHFPIDPRDLKEVRGTCGYRFSREDQP